MAFDGAKPAQQQRNKDWSAAIKPRRITGGLLYACFVLPLAFALLIFYIAQFTPDIALKLQATNWPAVPGVIQSRTIHETRGSQGGQYYRAEITYTYAANNRSYTASDVSPLAQFGEGRAAAQAVYDRYPLGSSVTIRYNFNKGSESMLEPGFDWQVVARVLFLIPPVVLVGAIYVASLTLFIRRLKGRAPGGLAADPGPPPRLRTVRLSPPCSGALCGSIAGWPAMMALGFVTQNLASPLSLLGGLAIMFGFWFAVWRHYHIGNLRSRYDIIIDPVSRILVLPTIKPSFRPRPPAAWESICLTSDLRNTGKRHTRYHSIWLIGWVNAEDPARTDQLVYETINAQDAREIAVWLSSHTGLPVGEQHPAS